ncbi:hypothetical protein [Actinomadura sp. HBU206391]|uniref:hypothetical protein n=1 Tax=Actinomadura sp. HBU206391 TaxID=2731692 RepID=UPI001650128F|nr:hypothetical protein [Actinomadura sp. HBU206391]MBC6458415.1 hypothetical protein [Actinomadura sp. HBU206391]
MRPLFVPGRRGAQRAVEATAEQIVATGAAGGAWGLDPLDSDRGWRPAGSTGREVPWWTTEKARIYSVTAYRSNPMATAIIDTYVAFCVGDSGVTYQASNPQVRRVVDDFWTDPRNQLAKRQELLLRSHLIMGESLYEMMTGSMSGAVRYCPIDPGRISSVDLYRGNPLWPSKVHLGGTEGAQDAPGYSVVAVNDQTGLLEGQAMFWPSFKALDTDVRGTPFLMSVLDQLDSFDTVLSNLIDRTALARYMVWDVTVEGGQDEVDDFVAARGGMHVPRSGSIEVHNDAVKWEPKHISTGADEDSVAARQTLTQVAAGAGLARTWLADPEDSNRATSLTMAEPVRRRVGGVQKLWLDYQTELTAYAIDRAVAAKRLSATVEALDPRTGERFEVSASRAVTITGPEIAAADAQITAQVLLNLSTGLEKLVQIGALSREGAKIAAKKAWEDYVGIPYTADLDSSEADPDDIATAIDDAQATEARKGKRGNSKVLHDYWTRGEGLAKWKTSAHPWTTLYRHLLKHMDGDEDLAKRTAADWYHDVMGHWPNQGDGKNRKSS